MSAIFAAEQFAGVSVYAPGGNVDHARIAGMEKDVIKNVVAALADASKARPSLTVVVGRIHLASAGAEQDVVRVLRIVSKGANIATFRSDRRLCGIERAHCE